MRISIASDHAGFEQKQALVGYLEDEGYETLDRGPASDDRVDYPDFAVLVADDVVGGAADLGILVCGTGIGMCISANKVDGIRAANCVQPELATLAREHNDANVLALSGRFVDLEANEAIVDAFLNASFAGGRHAGRVSKIMDIEKRA